MILLVCFSKFESRAFGVVGFCIASSSISSMLSYIKCYCSAAVIGTVCNIVVFLYFSYITSCRLAGYLCWFPHIVSDSISPLLPFLSFSSTSWGKNGAGTNVMRCIDKVFDISWPLMATVFKQISRVLNEPILWILIYCTNLFLFAQPQKVSLVSNACNVQQTMVLTNLKYSCLDELGKASAPFSSAGRRLVTVYLCRGALVLIMSWRSGCCGVSR